MDDIYLCVGIWMIFVGYLNVAYIVGQTIESKTDKGFLRYKQYPLFVLRKVNSHRKWFLCTIYPEQSRAELFEEIRKSEKEKIHL